MVLMYPPVTCWPGFASPSVTCWPGFASPSVTCSCGLTLRSALCMQYQFFVAILYIVIAFLFIAFGLCIYVGYSFQNNRFDLVW